MGTGHDTQAHGNMLQSEHDALAKGWKPDVGPTIKTFVLWRRNKPLRGRQVDAPVCAERCDELVAAEQHEALLQGDLQHVSDLGKVMAEGVNHLIEITKVQPSSVAKMITS